MSFFLDSAPMKIWKIWIIGHNRGGLGSEHSVSIEFEAGVNKWSKCLSTPVDSSMADEINGLCQ